MTTMAMTNRPMKTAVMYVMKPSPINDHEGSRIWFETSVTLSHFEDVAFVIKDAVISPVSVTDRSSSHAHTHVD